MAKLWQDRLKKRYGSKDLTGQKLVKVLNTIIANNNEATARAVGRLHAEKFELQNNRIKKDSGKFVLPNVDEVLPKKSVFVRKAQLQGDLITQTLKDDLTKQLRAVMDEFQADGKHMVIQIGSRAGKINNKMVEELEKRIETVFSGYVRANPQYDMPANIHTIAVTETRATINEIKKAYKDKMIAKNAGVQCYKQWIHNASLSKDGRKSHKQIDGKKIPEGDQFVLKEYKPDSVANGKATGQIYMMRYPHAQGAGAGSVIGCNCDIQYFFIKTI